MNFKEKEWLRFEELEIRVRSKWKAFHEKRESGKANNTFRVVVEVKLGKESRDHMVASFEHLGKKFIFSSKSNEEFLRVF